MDRYNPLQQAYLHQQMNHEMSSEMQEEDLQMWQLQQRRDEEQKLLQQQQEQEQQRLWQEHLDQQRENQLQQQREQEQQQMWEEQQRREEKQKVAQQQKEQEQQQLWQDHLDRQREKQLHQQREQEQQQILQQQQRREEEEKLFQQQQEHEQQKLWQEHLNRQKEQEQRQMLEEQKRIEEYSSQKVLPTKMKPLPKLQVIPPLSLTYPDATIDSDKLEMLEKNVHMMTIELEKICKRFKINNLNRDDLSQYTNYLSKYKNGKEQLKTAITCVSNAEKTLEKFKDFLTTDKYKEWNREQDGKETKQVWPDSRWSSTKKDSVTSTEASEAVQNWVQNSRFSDS